MSITRPLPENDRRARLSEPLEGYVVDVACARKYPRNELLERTREHTHECLQMGHCAESGYALVDDDGRLSLLDAAATPLVLEAIRGLGGAQGIRLRANREMKDQTNQAGLDRLGGKGDRA
ncbi:hypothetical protein BH20VER3_BH20VER3_03320 [soil metagenome]